MEPGDLNTFQQMVHVLCRARMVYHFHNHQEYLEDHCIRIIISILVLTINTSLKITDEKKYLSTQKAVWLLF